MGSLIELPIVFFMVFSVVIYALLLTSVGLIVWRVVDVVLNLRDLDGDEARERLPGRRWDRGHWYNRLTLIEVSLILAIVLIVFVLGIISMPHSGVVTVLSLIKNLALSLFLALLAIVNALALFKGRVLSRM